MSSSNLVRLGGVAAVVGGALFVIAELFYLVVGMSPSAEDLTSFSAIVQGVLFVLGGTLVVAGLLGLYAARKEELGGLGAAGFLVAFVGSVFAVGPSWTGAFAVPAIAAEAPALINARPPALVLAADITAFALFAIGWFLLGLALLRSRSYPRWAAVLLMVGAVAAFFPLPFSVIPFGVAVAWMGLSLLSGRSSVVGATAPTGVATEERTRVR